ncbi:hypothetical protein TPHA_0N00570 [Tetrapisispora phaffii CBS 4417]|uniref:AP complex subunit sigma n=1 Tax=Tetrapisispora phaffii (strain ATCC 24235 / CBS 4417 / NBRC 1672 / NRRL Y-8282 / UCD 70-5) TaxID=1071381 RepID=G8C110_TETPH|nr:hypothetical protein TPHA_0N00570 [Tetrapisispora phaffii CBS 4417]CCE65838.1 hypothetical protein TPHA_0N00570 [Tetrapisispora phaffii CBS 4417]
MIHGVLIFNKKCQPRLRKFYTPVELPKQKLLLEQVYSYISQRNTELQCSFMVAPSSVLSDSRGSVTDDDNIQIIYKNYATLYFAFIVDEQESELVILDLIQTFVEALDRCFTEVSELDLIFNWQTLESVLEEIIQGGMVIETSVAKIVNCVDDLNNASEESESGAGMFGGTAIGNAFQALTNGKFSQWASSQ